jgi:hypothetical protein
VPSLGADRVFLDPAGIRIDGLDPASDVPATAAVRAVGALLFTALTGAPPTPGRPSTTSVRRVRGGVPRALEAVVTAALSDRIAGSGELLGRLESLPRRGEPREPSARLLRVHRWSLRALPLAALAVVGLLAWTIGSDLGAVPGADVVTTTPHPLPQPGPASHGRTLVWSSPPAITAFDPEGDHSEDPHGVAAAVDGRSATGWSTDLYRTARFGGLKSGVGLLIDLGRPRRVDVAHLQLTAGGAALQLRAGDRRPRTATALPVVGKAGDAHRATTVTLRRPRRARFWLVWLTRLPAVPGGYREGVREIRLLQPAGH